MACVGCSCGKGTSDKEVSGCQSGGCSSGGCNRLNTFDWLSALEIEDSQRFDKVEVSFKNGARKEFFYNPDYIDAITGDYVAVDTGAGYDVGKVTLSGELVRMQMKKKRVNEKKDLSKILRIANNRDIERLEEARAKEKSTMVRARVIARSLDLKMKVGDVEYQADGKKATFFYTADGRVDFRELIRHFARDFKVKIEMRQIGIRQESARIGGLGSCGRELCCSTWLTNFKSVNTGAARYQNLAINQAKLSGQCGRLKCCLNFELDAYMDAFSKFPKRADKLKAQSGTASLFKTDIFKQIMYYMLEVDGGRRITFALNIDVVKKIKEMNKRGEFPVDFTSLQIVEEKQANEEEFDFEASDLTGVIELPAEKRRGKGRRNNRNRKKPSGKRPENRSQNGRKRTEGGSSNKPKPKSNQSNQPKNKAKSTDSKDGNKSSGRPPKKRNNRNRNRNKNRNQNNQNKKDDK